MIESGGRVTISCSVHIGMDEQDISQETLCYEIDRLHDELGKVPSFQDMYEHGNYSVYTYSSRFGSWNEAIEAAGYSPRSSRDEYTRSELIAEINRVADVCDKRPTLDDIAEHGDISRNTYHNRFDSWNDTLEAAGFEPRRSTNRIDDTKLVAALQELKADIKEIPTTTHMDENGPYSSGVYINRYGSWKAALEAAGISD